MKHVVVFLLDIPDCYLLDVKYVFSFLSNSWGLPIRYVFDDRQCDNVHIVYKKKVNDKVFDDVINIPFDESIYELQTDFPFEDCFDVRGMLKREIGAQDVIALIYRLLTMLDEKKINKKSRDSLGKFIVSALPGKRKEFVDYPLVDYLAKIILDRIFMIRPNLRLNIIPRWPDGKKYVVALSHDCDLLNIGQPREIAAAFLKGVVRRKKKYFEMALTGIKYYDAPMRSPFWGFAGWSEYESEHSIRSCFYLPVAPQKCPRHINDCKSDVLCGGIDRKVFREMQNLGWEFGLHPSIEAKNNNEEIVLQKNALENILDFSIVGVRHHYLAINNINPYNTFEKHVAAGFIYDTSIGWHERAGLRSGTSLPYYPYDPIKKKKISIIELPLSLMDTYVMHSLCLEEAIENGKNIMSTIRGVGGVIMLNWHAETYYNTSIYKNYFFVLKRVVEPIWKDSDVWVATPMQIANWWIKRDRMMKRISV